VLRACTMTLLVLCAEKDDAQAIGETIARLMPQHPSRAIVVRVAASPAAPIQARVFAQCWKPFGERRHICAEEVEIISAESALADVAPLLVPLPVADLPVVLWCRDVHLLDVPGFAGIARLANRIIFNQAPIERVQRILAQGQSAGDLAWTRLTHWRQLIARIFTNRGLGSVPGFSTVRVRWPAPAGHYLAAWLEDSLRRAGADPKVEVEVAAHGERRAELAAPDLRVVVSQCADRCAEIRINDVVNQTTLPDLDEYSLMREELAISGRDPVFERVLPTAARLALSS
jgi:hypothetical protein